MCPTADTITAIVRPVAIETPSTPAVSWMIEAAPAPMNSSANVPTNSAMPRWSVSSGVTRRSIRPPSDVRCASGRAACQSPGNDREDGDPMATLTPTQAQLLIEPNFAVVATVGKQGEPQSTVVWIDWDGENAVFNTRTVRAK